MNTVRIQDQAALKRQKTEQLLSTLERCQPVSRTELARLTEMSSASITRIVGALIALGLVREVSLTGSAGRGRKAVNLHTTPEGLYTLGCHIDPRSLRLCLMDFSYRACAERELTLAPGDLRIDRLAELTRELAPQLFPQDAGRLRWVGVSLSGQIDAATGRILRSKALDWSDADLAGPFSAALALPVYIENDIRACLTWERLRRGLGDELDMAYLYLGRAGIGFANAVGGRIVRGRSNSAGEIEDVVLALNERLSDHLMEDSLVARARKFAPSVSGIAGVLDALRMDLPWARVLMEDFTSHLNIVLQLICALLDPHCVILGGDIPEALRGWPGLLPDSRFSLGARYEDACALGAAAVAMQEAVHALIEGSGGSAL